MESKLARLIELHIQLQKKIADIEARKSQGTRKDE